MKKLLLILALLVAAAPIFAAGGGEQAARGSSEPVQLRWAHTLQPTHPIHDTAVAIADEVARRTDSQITIEVFPAGQLGDAEDIIEAASRGSIDIIWEAASNLSNFYSRFGVFEMPFVLSSYADFQKVYSSDLGMQMREEFRDQMNLVPLGVGNLGVRQITSNRPITSLSDFDGLKIRVPQVPAPLAAFRALGARPTPIAFSELYFSLQTGVVEAQENPITTIHAVKFYEVQDHITLSNHQLSVIMFLINEDVWDGLSDAQRQIVQEVVSQELDDYNTRLANNEQSLLDEMEAGGMQVHELSGSARGTIKARVESVYPEFESAWGSGTIEEVNRILSN